MLFLITLVLLAAVIGLAIYFGAMDADQRRQRWQHLTQSLPLRFALVATMTLLLMIPLEFVDSVVDERARRYQGVLSEISGIWGKTQTLTGPFLVVPYEYEEIRKRPFEKKDGTLEERVDFITHQDWAVFLPDTADFDSTIEPQYRQRGIYRSLVYKASVDLRGRFAEPDFSRLAQTPTRIDWSGAFLSLGLSDTRAIDESAALSWGDQPLGFAPGARYEALVSTGLHAELGEMIQPTGPTEFRIQLQLRGSEGLYFTPVGRQTTARIDSVWPDPSFRGSVLPTEHEIGEAGFVANWNVPHLARSYPQSWSRSHGQPELCDIQESSTGVRLFEPVDFYRTSERAIKYAVLFIGLTFLAFFLFEHTLGVRLSVIQYALVGGALALFYLLLISLAEHLGFLGAYLLAAIAVVSVVSLYAGAALRSRSKGWIMGLVLTTTYGVLYVLLQQQDYALLLGTLLLFAVLALTMFLTRNLSQPSTTLTRRTATS